MAILNGIEGAAHVEVASDNRNWSGYILIEDDPSNLRYFDIAGPQAQTVYEGPILVSGKYFRVAAKVRVIKMIYNPDGCKIEFKGIEIPERMIALNGKPEDYLP
jgi:hypothetical protein